MHQPNQDGPYEIEGHGFFRKSAEQGSIGALEELRDLSALERRSLKGIIALLSEYGLRREPEAQTQGWGAQVGKPEVSTCAHLVTQDCHVIRLAIGPHGTYQLHILASDASVSEISDALAAELGSMLGARDTILERTVGHFTRNGPVFEGWLRWQNTIHERVQAEAQRIRTLLPGLNEAEGEPGDSAGA